MKKHITNKLNLVSKLLSGGLEHKLFDVAFVLRVHIPLTPISSVKQNVNLVNLGMEFCNPLVPSISIYLTKRNYLCRFPLPSVKDVKMIGWVAQGQAR